MRHKKRVIYKHVRLDDGRNVVLFVNRDMELVVVDIVARDGRSGNEVLRRWVKHDSR